MLRPAQRAEFELRNFPKSSLAKFYMVQMLSNKRVKYNRQLLVARQRDDKWLLFVKNVQNKKEAFKRTPSNEVESWVL